STPLTPSPQGLAPESAPPAAVQNDGGESSLQHQAGITESAREPARQEVDAPIGAASTTLSEIAQAREAAAALRGTGARARRPEVQRVPEQGNARVDVRGSPSVQASSDAIQASAQPLNVPTQQFSTSKAGSSEQARPISPSGSNAQPESN